MTAALVLLTAATLMAAITTWALLAERPHRRARHRTTGWARALTRRAAGLRPPLPTFGRLRPLPAEDTLTIAWVHELNHGPRLSPLTRARTIAAAWALVAARYAPQGDAGPGEWPWLERAWADDTGSFAAIVGVS